MSAMTESQSKGQSGGEGVKGARKRRKTSLKRVR